MSGSTVPAQQVVLRRALRRAVRAPVKALGRFLWKKGDGAVIDGARAGRASRPTRCVVRRRMSGCRSGYVYHYAFAMLIGVVALVTWYHARRGASER